jgi:hypothetical protein
MTDELKRFVAGKDEERRQGERRRWSREEGERRKSGWHEEVLVALNGHADRIENRLKRWIRKITIGFVILGMACALALVGYGYLLRQQHKTTDRIQAQRKEFTRQSCVDQNIRHEHSLNVINSVIRKAEKKNPELKKNYEASKTANILLINALVPKQNCAALVKAAVAVGGSVAAKGN